MLQLVTWFINDHKMRLKLQFLIYCPECCYAITYYETIHNSMLGVIYRAGITAILTLLGVRVCHFPLSWLQLAITTPTALTFSCL